MRNEFPNCSLRRSLSDPIVMDRHLENQMLLGRLNGFGNPWPSDLKALGHLPFSSAGEVGVHLESSAERPPRSFGHSSLNYHQSVCRPAAWAAEYTARGRTQYVFPSIRETAHFMGEKWDAEVGPGSPVPVWMPRAYAWSGDQNRSDCIMSLAFRVTRNL